MSQDDLGDGLCFCGEQLDDDGFCPECDAPDFRDGSADWQEATDRLEEIKEDMLQLLAEAKTLIAHNADDRVYERARSYWLAHVETALTKEHGYLGGSMVTMEDTIQEMSQ